MKFIYPSFLFALSAILIPIIIHFFNFRKYKTIYFSDLFFLRNIEQDSKSRNRLRHLLVLFTRILIIVFLVLAFAKPYIPLNHKTIQGSNYIVAIYIDNSFSMEAEAKSGKLIEIAKKKAIEVAKAYPPSTKFLLTTNNYEVKLNHVINIDQIVNEISNVKTTSITRTIDEIRVRQIELANDFSSNNSNKYVKEFYWISDGQKSTFTLKNINDSLNYSTNILLLASENLGNIYIDSCWFTTPARIFKQVDKLKIKINNNSNKEYSNFPLKLFINDSLKAISNISLKPNSYGIAEMTYTNAKKGMMNGKIEINDYPITFDNKLYFNYLIAEKSNILIINEKEENIYLNALFEKDDFFELNKAPINNLDYSKFNRYQVIILNGIKNFSTGFIQQLKLYMEKGGTVVVFPGKKIDLVSYNSLLNSINSVKISRLDSINIEANNIAFDNKIYYNVFSEKNRKIKYPVIIKHYKIIPSVQSNYYSIIVANNQQPVLCETMYKSGKLYLFSFPLSLDFSDFPQNPLFVPTLYNIALYNQQNAKLYYIIGDRKNIYISKNDSINGNNKITIANKFLNYENIIEGGNQINNSEIKLPDNIIYSGFYQLLEDNENFGFVAFNYSRLESKLDCYSKEDLREQIRLRNSQSVSIIDKIDKDITNQIKDYNFGQQLWKLFIVLALIMLAFEIFVLRVFYK
ncbi:MAG: hypothetical protein GXO79_14170 [Chlorobi bacterium]|nr:hypothetical protein [Chlorobiota bacterium]